MKLKVHQFISKTEYYLYDNSPHLDNKNIPIKLFEWCNMNFSNTLHMLWSAGNNNNSFHNYPQFQDSCCNYVCQIPLFVQTLSTSESRRHCLCNWTQMCYLITVFGLFRVNFFVYKTDENEQDNIMKNCTYNEQSKLVQFQKRWINSF